MALLTPSRFACAACDYDLRHRREDIMQNADVTCPECGAAIDRLHLVRTFRNRRLLFAIIPALLMPFTVFVSTWLETNDVMLPMIIRRTTGIIAIGGPASSRVFVAVMTMLIFGLLWHATQQLATHDMKKRRPMAIFFSLLVFNLIAGVMLTTIILGVRGMLTP